MIQEPSGAKLESVDPIWHEVRKEAEAAIQHEPALSSTLFAAILSHTSLEEVIATRIAERLENNDLRASILIDAYREAFADQQSLGDIIRSDIAAVYERDPACMRFIEPLLYFKGFQAIQSHRLAHWLLKRGKRDFALMIQSAVSATFQVDINPAVTLGRGLFIDHATGVVIGETAVIGDNVSILQDVTLGGTGKTGGDRHPKVEDGVLIGAGAKVLGNINIGHCARVAAGSVVLKSIPPEMTVAGVPAKIVGKAGCAKPARSMDQILAEKELLFAGDGI